MILNNLKIILSIIFNPIKAAKGKTNQIYDIKIMRWFIIIMSFGNVISITLSNSKYHLPLPLILIISLMTAIIICKLIIPALINIERIIVNKCIRYNISKEIYYKMVLPYFTVGILFNTVANILLESRYIIEIITLIIILWELLQRYLLIKYRVSKKDIIVNGKIINLIITIIIVQITLITLKQSYNQEDFAVEINNNIIRDEIYMVNNLIFDTCLDVVENEADIDYDTYIYKKNLLYGRMSDSSASIYYDVDKMTDNEIELEKNVQTLLKISYNIYIQRQENNDNVQLIEQYEKIKNTINELIQEYYSK